MNAKDEFIYYTKGLEVKCATLFGVEFSRLDGFLAVLRVGYSEEEYSEFLKEIDFEYNDGFGGQNLDGYIWHEDGSWYERGEYNGCEWWEFKRYPVIPNYLM